MNKLECIVKAMSDQLASDIVAIDMSEASPLYDTFVIASASNSRLMQAIKDNVVDECFKNNFDIKHVEGNKESQWILIDAGEIIIHIFDKKEREKYNLEKLWGDMPKIDLGDLL